MKKKTIALSLAGAALITSPLIYLAKRSGYGYTVGNEERFDVDHTGVFMNSPLKGKRILFLGSSVTYGSASKGESFVDYMQKKDGILPYKEALSGTTLVDEEVKGKKSYVTRLKNVDPEEKFDLFVCQLSTNDASLKKPLGKVSASYGKENFDTHTIAGAIEYIIAYVKETFECPILFYTGTKYNSKAYEKMIRLLYQIKEKWGVEILDLWNNKEMNDVSRQEYRLYMVNGIHPSKAGYREWWTPKFEEKIKEILVK